MPEFANTLQKMQFEELSKLINQRNDLVSQLNAATGDKDSLAKHFEESEEFTAIREQIASLKEELAKQVAAKVEAAVNENGSDVEETQAKIAEIDKTVKPGVLYYKQLHGDDAASEFPKLERVKGKRAGGGSGGKRVRGFNWVVTEDNGEVTEYDNASGVAKALGADTKALQEHFFAKAGVEKSADAPDEVTFSLEWADVDEEGAEVPRSATVRAYRTESTDTNDESSDEEAAEAPSEAELEEV